MFIDLLDVDRLIHHPVFDFLNCSVIVQIYSYIMDLSTKYININTQIMKNIVTNKEVSYIILP